MALFLSILVHLPRPRLTPVGVLMGLLVLLMVSSVFYTRESLLFCEKALYGELSTLAKEGTLKAPIRFPEVCPDVRQRAETLTNKWLEVILALMVQWGPHNP